MGLPQGAMIVAHEKDDTGLYESYLAMLVHRRGVGIYYDGDDLKGANTIILATSAIDYVGGDPVARQAVEDAAERFLRERIDYEYEGFEVRTPIMRPTSPGSAVTRPTSV